MIDWAHLFWLRRHISMGRGRWCNISRHLGARLPLQSKLLRLVLLRRFDCCALEFLPLARAADQSFEAAAYGERRQTVELTGWQTAGCLD